MIKNNYEQPLAELIVVRFEENILSGDNEGFKTVTDFDGTLEDEDD